ncbi:MAG: transporter substrate-binding domain-containing protein [Lachnospiraceae bacterium]|nr:transporter substrate-binding domain-containing protein [Lachnospiraceae bacterium]
MSKKEKWLTILVCFVLLILCAGLGAFKKKEVKTGISAVSELNGKALGGVEGRMPGNSAKIFFESMLGIKLSRYSAYKNMDEALYALRTGKVAAIWAADVTVDYLQKWNPDCYPVDTSGTASIMELPEGRFDFGLAAKNDSKGKELVESLNGVIEAMKTDGTLAALTEQYIYRDENSDRFTEKDMLNKNKKNALRIGITGATQPVELINESGKPYGFCVAFMDEVGLRLGRKVEFVVLDNETIFTSLMSGKIDAVFCYGTPGKITTEGTRKWITTDGYLQCGGYKLLSVKDE